jgi:hypothetical protein
MSSKSDMLGEIHQKLITNPVLIGVVYDFLTKAPRNPALVEAVKIALRQKETWPVALFVHDMTKEGWTLLEDVGDPWPISNPPPDFVPFLRDSDGGYISGEEMATRAVSLNVNFGQRRAEYYLKHQDEIPECFQVCVLVFPGTVWRDRDGNRYVPYLYWFGERWHSSFYRLVYGFRSLCRLVRPRE